MSKLTRFLFTAFLSVLILTGAATVPVRAQISDYLCKQISNEWAWFSDHFTFSVTYLVKAGNNREYEIGTGISINGTPYGRVKKGTNITKATAYGIGAIHVRFSDNKGPGQVCVALENIEAVKLPGSNF